MTGDRPAATLDALTRVLHDEHCTAYTHEGRNGKCEREARSILASGVLRDEADVRRDALAAVEALLPEFERWERTNRLNSKPGSDPELHAEDYMLGRADVLVEVIKHLRAVLDGDTSALDAVKAAERERIAQAQESRRSAYPMSQRYIVDELTRIAREGSTP